MRCLYVDLDGTLLGPGGSLLRGADGRFALDGVRALQACSRADVEVVLYSGRRQSSVFEDSRLIGSSSYIFELGCGLVLDGELEWLTDGVVPSAESGTIYEQIERSGAPALLLDRFAGRLEYHTPWSVGREVSHLFRGALDLDVAHEVLDRRRPRLAAARRQRRRPRSVRADGRAAGRPRLPPDPRRRVEGARRRPAHAGARLRRAPIASRSAIRARTWTPRWSSAAFWLVANALERDPDLASEIAGRRGVRVASEPYGAGVYEAVVTTLATER